jgi:MYXO-CTERM domain-containing protein
VRARSKASSIAWTALALLALASPILWLAAWPHTHPVTSWIAVALLALAGLWALRRG